MARLLTLKLSNLFSYEPISNAASENKSTITFADINVIAGPNDSGKSNIFRAIKLLVDALSGLQITKSELFSSTSNSQLVAELLLSENESKLLLDFFSVYFSPSIGSTKMVNVYIYQNGQKLLEAFRKLRIKAEWGKLRNNLCELTLVVYFDSIAIEIYCNTWSDSYVGKNYSRLRQIAFQENLPALLDKLVDDNKTEQNAAIALRDATNKFYVISPIRLNAQSNTNESEIVERLSAYSGLPLNSSYELPFSKLLNAILEKSLVISSGGTIFSKKKALIEKMVNPHKSISEEMKESLESPKPLESDGWNLSEFLFNLKNSSEPQARKHFSDIQEAFTSLFPGLHFDVIYQAIKLPRETHDGQQYDFRYPSIIFMDSLNSKQFSLEKVGAGISECLFLLSASLGSDDRILLLDEPAVNLHPAQMKAFFQLLGNSSNQLFVITHSPPLLRNLLFDKGASLIYVRRPDGISIIHMLEPKGKWSDDERYKLSYLVDPRIFFARHVILSEGETDKEFLETAAQEFGLNPDTYEDIVIDAKSKDNIPKYREILKSLNTPFIVVGDEDKKEPSVLEARAMNYASEKSYTIIEPKLQLPESPLGQVFFLKGNVEAFMMATDFDLYNEVERELCQSRINSKPVFIHAFLPKLLSKSPHILDSTIKPLLEYAFDIDSRPKVSQ